VGRWGPAGSGCVGGAKRAQKRRSQANWVHFCQSGATGVVWGRQDAPRRCDCTEKVTRAGAAVPVGEGVSGRRPVPAPAVLAGGPCRRGR
jgi:hypothetical protein